MIFEEAKCPNCGAQLSVFMSIGRASCEFCGNNYIIKNNDSKQIDRSKGVNISSSNISFIYEETETIHLQSNETDKIRVALLVIAGLSYALGKNYKIIIGDNSTYIYQKGEISKEEKKRVLKGKVRSAKALINKDFEKIESNTYNFGLENFISFLSKYDCKTIEEVKHKKEDRYLAYGEYSSRCKCLCDVFYSFIIGELIITPTYLKKHFTHYVDCFERIKNKKAISIIAEQLSENLIKSTANDSAYETIFITSICCHHTGNNDRYLGKFVRIAYNDIGMANISDEKIQFAVCIAVIAEVIKLTNKVDCPFDLVPNMLRSNSKPKGIEWSPILKELNVDLRQVKQIVYNEW